MRRRLLRLALLGLVASALLPARAAAHAVLLRVVPANGTSVATAPRVVRFTFDDTVRPGPDIKAIRNGGGSVQAGPVRAAGRVLDVPLRRGLQDGVYTVRWSAISDDGHVIGGVTAFAVGTGGNVVPGLSAGSGGPGAFAILARWLFFLGLVAAAGIAVFHFVVWRVELPDADETERERRVGSPLLAACLALALAGALILLWLSHATFETRFGRVLTAAAIVAGAGLVAALASVSARYVRMPALVAAVLLLPAPALAGHALDPGRSRLDLVLDVAHVTAAAVWVGGLLSLLVVVPLVVSREDKRRSLAVRFSSLALASVALLVGTGIWRAVVELASFSQLWDTGYGRAILVKIALLGALLVLAARNRFAFLRGPYSRLRRGVAWETVLLAGVVVAVAFLTDLPPGRVSAATRAAPASPALARAPALPPRSAFVLAGEAKELAVGLAALPLSSAAVRLTATVVSPDNTGVDGLRVAFNDVPASACGSGCYAAVVPRSRVVRVTLSGRTVRFRLPTRARPGQALIAQATAAFRRLRNVDYVERLSSGQAVTVTSKWRLQAPDRLSFSIPGGSAGIIIGSRRWDRRAPGAPWTRTEASPLHQPTPVWGSSPSNARILEQTKRVAVVSLLNRSLPAWFEISFDRKTLRPLSMRMTAAAHFMTHRYTAFNSGPGVEPPR